MTDTVLDVLLGVSVLLVATVAVFAPRRMVASMTFLVLGLLLAIVWARLGSPDIALAETAIASGVTGALLVAAATEHPRRRRPDRSPRLAVLEVIGGAILAGGIAAALSVAFVVALRDGASLPRLGDEALAAVPQTPVSHPITSVLLDFRAYDTMLEVAVLTTAAAAAVALHRAGRIDRVVVPADPRPLLVALVRLVVPVLLVIAFWMLVAGSTRTGGAFQSGAVLTGALLALFLSGRVPMASTGRWLVPAVVLGLAVFLLVAVGAAVLGDGWLVLDESWGGTAILAVESALAVSIGAALATLVLAGFPDAEEIRP